MMGLVLAAGLVGFGGAEGATDLVVILCDDLGYGDLGCFGHPKIKTPHLDRLASEGVRMTRWYAAAPVCSPSRAGMITGRHPHRSGIRDWIPPGSGITLPRDAPSVARVLKRAGYATAHVGKWHLNSRWDGSEPTPGDFGFDHWFSTQNNAAPDHQDPTNFVRNGVVAGPLRGNSSTLIVDEAIGWMEKQAEAPIALFVWFHAPHEIVAVPPADRDPYRRLDTPEDPERSTYYGSVARVDAEVGRLLGALDRLGRRDRALVLFTSDNGPETLRRYPNASRSYGSAGPLRGMKLDLYEGGFRVPAIVRWPGKVMPGTTSDVPAGHVDIRSTFAAIVGADADDPDTDGADIRAALAGKPVIRAVPLYWEYDKALAQPWRSALIDGDWKLLSDADLGRFALFHLAEDPHEDLDRFHAEPDRARALVEQLRARKGAVNPED